jgi:hypothetical protein|tara:strand:- start:255 stop:434 length:180 start_codon:yes stop_codon:yes gene_type:complete
MIKINKKKSKEKLKECSTCKTEFSLKNEGGISGLFGMIPVAFCPTCLSSCIEMAEQFKS